MRPDASPAALSWHELGEATRELYVNVADARDALAGGERDAARTSLDDARADLDRIDTLVAAADRDGDMAFVPMAADAVEIEEVVPAEGHGETTRTATGKRPDASGAYQEAADAELWYSEIALPLAETASRVNAARALLDQGQLAEAGQELDGVETSVVLFEAADAAPLTHARWSLLAAKRSIVAGDHRSAELQLEDAATALDRQLEVESDVAEGDPGYALALHRSLEEMTASLTRLRVALDAWQPGDEAGLRGLLRHTRAIERQWVVRHALRKQRRKERRALTEALQSTELAEDYSVWALDRAAAEEQWSRARQRLQEASQVAGPEIRGRVDGLIASLDELQGLEQAEGHARVWELNAAIQDDLRELIYEI